MEGPPNSTTNWLDTGDEGELRPLEVCLLKFMWVSSEHLDSVDFIKTAILIRSLSVGKRMTRTLVCDMLAEFTRFFRCAQTESKFNSKTCDTWCSKTKEALESWMNYDVNHNTANNNNKICKTDTESSSRENGQFSYQNPFDCPINLDAIVKSLTTIDKEQTTSTKMTEEADENQNLLLTVKDVSKTLEKYTKRYSTYLHSLDKTTSPPPTRTSIHGEHQYSSWSSSGLEDTQILPVVETELVLSECLLKQSEWLESILRGKTPEKEDICGCDISHSSVNDVQEEEESLLGEFTSMAQNFLPIWSAGHSELNKLGNNLEDGKCQKQICTLETNTCPERSPVYEETSTILEEVSMDISDSFDEWFADSRNVIQLQLLQSKGLQSLPDGFLDPQDASTPLEELQGEKEQEVDSVWPKLPTINPHTRRRLWDDTDIGVRELADVDTSHSRLEPAQEEKERDGKTKDGTAEDDFQYIYLSDEPIPNVEELSFYYPEETVAPTTRPTETRASAQPEMFHTKYSGAPSQAYLPATHSMPHHHPHPQVIFQNSHPQMQQRDKGMTWAQRALNGILPHHNPNSTAVTHCHNYGQGPFVPYNLWAHPPPNAMQHVPGHIQAPVINNPPRYHAPIGTTMAPPNAYYADWQRNSQLDKNTPLYNMFPGAGKSQAQINAEFSMKQGMIRQQMQQPPLGKNNLGRHAPNPSIPSQHTMKQPQQAKQQHLPNYSANFPSSKAPTEFDMFFPQDLQKRAWSTAEQLMANGQIHTVSAGETGTAFRPHPSQHFEHQAFMQNQKQDQHKFLQQYMHQQPPMHQHLPREGHAIPDVLPPWRRPRPPQDNIHSLNHNQGFAHVPFEAWPVTEIHASVPERLGPEQGLSSSSIHNTRDPWISQLHNTNAQSNFQLNNPSQVPTSKAHFTANASQSPSVSETHDMQRRKGFDIDEWKYHQYQLLQTNSRLQQAHPELYNYPIQEFPPMQRGPLPAPAPPPPFVDYGSSKDSMTYPAAAYGGHNYPSSVFQAFSPQKQQQARHGVPSMAEVAWASLGHNKPQTHHLPPSAEQRYQSVRPMM